MSDIQTPLPGSSFGTPMPPGAGLSIVGVGPALLLRAVLFGLIGAVLGGLVWVGSVVFTEHIFMMLAALVGILVGAGIHLGAGQRRSVVLALAAALIALFTLAASEYFIVRHFSMQQMQAEGFKGDIPLLLPFRDMIDVVIDSLRFEPVNLAYWLAAVAIAFMIPFRGRVR
jgi:hypothetical protein